MGTFKNIRQTFIAELILIMIYPKDTPAQLIERFIYM